MDEPGPLTISVANDPTRTSFISSANSKSGLVANPEKRQNSRLFRRHLGNAAIRILRVNGNSSGAVFMRGLTILFFAALSIVGFAASSSAHEKIRLAQNSVAITCMMTCNSQYANCQSSCLATGTQLQSSPLGLRTNADPNANQVCLASCTNQQLQCQIVCARSSP